MVFTGTGVLSRCSVVLMYMVWTIGTQRTVGDAYFPTRPLSLRCSPLDKVSFSVVRTHCCGTDWAQPWPTVSAARKRWTLIVTLCNCHRASSDVAITLVSPASIWASTGNCRFDAVLQFELWAPAT